MRFPWGGEGEGGGDFQPWGRRGKEQEKEETKEKHKESERIVWGCWWGTSWTTCLGCYTVLFLFALFFCFIFNFITDNNVKIQHYIFYNHFNNKNDLTSYLLHFFFFFLGCNFTHPATYKNSLGKFKFNIWKLERCISDQFGLFQSFSFIRSNLVNFHLFT